MIKNKRTATVIVPTYNRAHYIGEAIDSILAQDIVDCELEIIVVDDGSKDNTEEVVRNYGDRVRYIRQENQGAGVARNRGIDEARGEWIAFLDSDDRWLPYKLSLQFRVLDKFPQYKIIHSNFYSFEGSEIIIPKGLEYWVKTISNKNTVNWCDAYSNVYDSSEYEISQDGNIFKIYTGNIFAAMLYALYGACWTMIIHRSCLNEDVKFAERFKTWEDYWFLCKLSEYNDIIFIDVATAENRGHRGPRLTSRPDLIDPLKCHLEICKNIYMKSKSSNKPSASKIADKYKNIHLNLMKEYMKIGDLQGAKNTRKIISNIENVKSGTIEKILMILTYLPFNVVSYLVSLKRWVANV